MNKNITIAVSIIIILAVTAIIGVGILAWQGGWVEQVVPVKQQSFILSFVDSVSKAHKSTDTGGILPDPPREQLKKAEEVVAKQIESPVKIVYSLTDYLPSPPLTHTLVLYAVPNPFMWRTDFIMNLDDGKHQNTYAYNGSNYLNCSADGDEPLECFDAPDTFLEKYLSTPLPLTEFLNYALDPQTLKKLITKAGKEYSQTIASFPADCRIVTDQYNKVDFCFAKAYPNLLLYLDFEVYARRFTLRGESADFSPSFPLEIFISPSKLKF